jgi:hypothetical protein
MSRLEREEMVDSRSHRSEGTGQVLAWPFRQPRSLPPARSVGRHRPTRIETDDDWQTLAGHCRSGASSSLAWRRADGT